MTVVTVVKKQDHVVFVEVKGHTGYAESGSDIVCAAISSIVQTAVLGLKNVTKTDFKYVIEDGAMEIDVSLPEGDDRYKADIVLDTMLCGVADLAEGYPEFIKLEVK